MSHTAMLPSPGPARPPTTTTLLLPPTYSTARAPRLSPCQYMRELGKKQAQDRKGEIVSTGRCTKGKNLQSLKGIEPGSVMVDACWLPVVAFTLHLRAACRCSSPSGRA